MNFPMPKPGADPASENQPLVTEHLVNEQLQTLAALDVSEHAQIYEALLSDLQRDLNQTGRGA